MQVKAFQHVVQVGDRYGTLEQIEAKMNRWLADHPDIQVRHIQLDVAGATNNERAAPATFAALCLLFYEAADA